MNTQQFKLGINNNPITHNLYSANWNIGLVAPGSQKILITENNFDISTEDGNLLTTES